MNTSFIFPENIPDREFDTSINFWYV